MKLINLTKTYKIQPDNNYIPDHLGEFSDEKGKFAVLHSNDTREFTYFNADNVENMKEAKENYKEYMEFEKGNRSAVSIKAVATLTFDSLNGWATERTIESCGLYGIEVDYKTKEDGIINEYGPDQMHELNEMLEAIGLSKYAK